MTYTLGSVQKMEHLTQRSQFRTPTHFKLLSVARNVGLDNTSGANIAELVGKVCLPKKRRRKKPVGPRLRPICWRSRRPASQRCRRWRTVRREASKSSSTTRGRRWRKSRYLRNAVARVRARGSMSCADVHVFSRGKTGPECAHDTASTMMNRQNESRYASSVLRPIRSSCFPGFQTARNTEFLSSSYMFSTKTHEQAMMNALTEDQKTIEGILEGERVRMEESFRSAAAARKARDEKHAEEDAVEEWCGKSTDVICRPHMSRQR